MSPDFHWEMLMYLQLLICMYSAHSLYSLESAAAAKLLQSCPTLCDPIDGSPPGSPFPGILQARTLEWVAISFSNAWKWKVKGKFLSCVQLLATPWTAAHQAPPSMGFSRQEYWSGVPLPSPWSLLVQSFSQFLHHWLGFPGGSLGKNPPAKQETQVWSLGKEDPLDKEMATHCSTISWEIQDREP